VNNVNNKNLVFLNPIVYFSFVNFYILKHLNTSNFEREILYKVYTYKYISISPYLEVNYECEIWIQSLSRYTHWFKKSVILDAG